MKLRLLHRIGEQLKPSGLIASNTSSISITKLAAATPCAERFMGLHFFNPVPMMPLVELIRGVQTADSTAAAMANLRGASARRRSRCATPQGLLCPMINEAFYALASAKRSTTG